MCLLFECAGVYTAVCYLSLSLSLSLSQAELVQSPLDLTQYNNVLIYWRTEVLPPTGAGVLSIMGVLQVRDVAYYLQYYSLPVLTAICTPLVKIVLSLRTVYRR